MRGTSSFPQQGRCPGKDPATLSWRVETGPRRLRCLAFNVLGDNANRLGCTANLPRHANDFHGDLVGGQYVRLGRTFAEQVVARTSGQPTAEASFVCIVEQRITVGASMHRLDMVNPGRQIRGH